MFILTTEVHGVFYTEVHGGGFTRRFTEFLHGDSRRWFYTEVHGEDLHGGSRRFYGTLYEPPCTDSVHLRVYDHSVVAS